MKKKLKVVGSLIFVIVTVIVLVVFLFPILWIFLTSIKTQVQTWTIPPLFIFKPTLSKYLIVLRAKNYLGYLTNSLIIAGTGTFLIVICGSMAAYAFTRFRFRGSASISTGILTIRMFPPVVLGVPIFLLMRNLGLLDTHISPVLADTSFGLPFIIWLMVGFFKGVPLELDDAARIDGCSWFSAYWRVTLPAVAPGLVATSILSFVYIWNEFFFALILTREEAKPASVAVSEFVTRLGVDWGAITAAASLMVIPTIAFSILAQKHLIRGLTAGAVKG